MESWAGTSNLAFCTGYMYNASTFFSKSRNVVFNVQKTWNIQYYFSPYGSRQCLRLYYDRVRLTQSWGYPYPPPGDALDSFSGSSLCTTFCITCTQKFPVNSWIAYIYKIHLMFLCRYIEVCDVVVFNFVEEKMDTPYLLMYAVINRNSIMFADREAT